MPQYKSEPEHELKSKHDNATPYLSADYDAQVRGTIPYYDSFHQETINLVRASHSSPALWLDTGCGTGTLASIALKAFPEVRFMLADPSVEMLGQARKKLAGYPQERVTFLDPVPTQEINISESPDVITAIQSHHYFSEAGRAKACARCYDLLSPGGIYITFENIRPLTERGTEIGKECWKNFQLSQGRTLEDVNRHIERFDKEFFPITAEEHLSLLRDCGFEAVELLWYSYMQAGFYAVKRSDAYRIK